MRSGSATLERPSRQIVVHFGGRFVDADEARVRITDRGYLLGEGVFATMRGYDGVCFASREHLATLARGAASFGLRIPMALDALADVADEAATKVGGAAYVRVTLARGTEEESVLSLIARPFDVPPPHAYVDGIDVVTVSLRRAPPACGDPTVKSTSYGPQVLVRREVASKDASEGIVLAVDGSLACGTMANLFLVRGDDLLTPSLESGCRDGVTRRAILALAERVGLRAREQRLDPSELAAADEVFFASTRVECVPVARIDDRPLRGARTRYPRTTALRSALHEVVRDDTAARRKAPRGTS